MHAFDCFVDFYCVLRMVHFILRRLEGTVLKNDSMHIIIRCIKTISHENARPLPLRSRRLVFRRHTDVNESASDPAAAFCDLLQHELALLFVTHHWRISKTGTTQHHMPMHGIGFYWYD
jgi:hypothetical protein